MDYVSDEAATFALELERRFQSLPESSGILFISVRATPAPEGKVKNYEVRLGISRNLEEETGQAIIKHVLKDEIAEGRFQFFAAVHRGSRGPAYDKGDAGPRQTQA